MDDGYNISVVKDLRVKSVRLTGIPREVDRKIDGNSIVLKTYFFKKNK
jgi:uncharacterized Zn ribbon protein